MRFLAAAARDFDETYLSFSGDAVVRDATWADLARMTVLYNHSEPRWLIKDYLTGSFQSTRYESHFVKLMRRVEDRRGIFLALENPVRRVVGAVVVERTDTFFEQHCGTLSFRVSPGYLHQTSLLLAEVESRAQQMGIVLLQVHVGGRDNNQRDLVMASGFSEEARLKGRLRDNGGWTDMVVYTKRLAGDAAPVRGEGEFYGGRQPWQAERVITRRQGSP